MLILETTAKFNEKIEGLHPKPARLDEWLKGFEFVLTRNPEKGMFVCKHPNGAVYAIKQIDVANSRWITFFYTFNAQKVVFIDLIVSHNP